MLQEDLAAGVQLRRVGVRDAVDALDGKGSGQCRSGPSEMVGEGRRHGRRGYQPERTAGEGGRAAEKLAQLLRMRMHHERG